MREGKIKEALSIYAEAQRLDPTLKISANSWSTLCRFGSLWGHAADVVNVCEKAVALEPEDVNYHDSRGLARALTGKTEGAIEDFQDFINWTDYGVQKSQREHWIEALQAGNNPFTPEELEKLRRQ